MLFSKVDGVNECERVKERERKKESERENFFRHSCSTQPRVLLCGRVAPHARTTFDPKSLSRLNVSYNLQTNASVHHPPWC